MIKPDSLRATITQSLPELARDPDRLALWIEDGSITAHQAAHDQSFEYAYKLHILIEDLAASPSLVMIAIVAWLQVNQPGQLAVGDQAFPFNADILDNGLIDVKIILDLKEAVHATRREDGGFDLQHLPEPDPLFDDELGAGSISPVPNLHGVSVNADQLIPEAFA